jgi:methyl-accepting chemotaxis protein
MQGRGFAVVAEEVGNLAEVSGKAAKEIQSLLDDSRQHILALLNETKGRAKEGSEITKEAVIKFASIANNISAIVNQVDNLDGAAREQESGIRQVTQSMSEMGEAVRVNRKVASTVSESAERLADESQNLDQAMAAIMALISGENKLSVSEGDQGPAFADEAQVHS